MKRYLLYILLGLLVVANTVTMVMLWYRPRRAERTERLTPRGFLIRELRFDAGQERSFVALADSHRHVADSLLREIVDAKRDMFALLKQAPITDSARRAGVSRVGRLKEALDMATLDHFAKVRALCRPDQRERLDAILRDMVARNGMGRPPGRPGRDGAGPMPPPDGKGGGDVD